MGKRSAGENKAQGMSIWGLFGTAISKNRRKQMAFFKRIGSKTDNCDREGKKKLKQKMLNREYRNDNNK
jgi:hypothetical protein